MHGLASAMLRKYNASLRKDGGLTADIMVYRILLPHNTDIARLLLDTCTCEDSTTCCTPADLSNFDVDDFTTVSAANDGKIVDLTSSDTDWYALALPTLNPAQVGAIRKQSTA